MKFDFEFAEFLQDSVDSTWLKSKFLQIFLNVVLPFL